jgi:hypothetical protein
LTSLNIPPKNHPAQNSPSYSDIPAIETPPPSSYRKRTKKQHSGTKTNMSGSAKAIRLPPLKTLRVHNPKRQPENPCIAIMSSVLGTYFQGQK